ncbi:zinc-dependent alcohol dehydrogenase [Parahaliea mediterranea]|uniref:zinc-dependent alcohol dehydrogenase n=1 Tax=Parahaliea mediterranea TaxID=651086 RepID=UPI000E2F0249|nr:zinc-binding dehydrogenase [Parahaliea mediterranea]
MRSANFIDPGQIEMRDDASAPTPAAGEVIVAVQSCGICGSDLHMYRNNSSRDVLVRATPEGYEIPGHEFAGCISAIGDGVSGWAVGDRVVGVTGQGGGMADFVAVPDNPFQLVAMPDGVSFQEAATTEPLADGLQMVRKAAAEPGENVLVFGVGIIGLGVIQAYRAAGAELGALIAVDVHDARLEKALAVGATHAVNARDGDLVAQIQAITGVENDWRGTSANIQVVIDCAGYIKHMPGPPPLETALQLVACENGRIVCFGAYEDKMLIDMMPLIRKQPVIMGSNGYAAEDLTHALQLMRDGSVDRLGLISHSFPLEQIDAAFATQATPQAVKVMIDIRCAVDRPRR